MKVNKILSSLAVLGLVVGTFQIALAETPSVPVEDLTLVEESEVNCPVCEAALAGEEVADDVTHGEHDGGGHGGGHDHGGGHGHGHGHHHHHHHGHHHHHHHGHGHHHHHHHFSDAGMEDSIPQPQVGLN